MTYCRRFMDLREKKGVKRKGRKEVAEGQEIPREPAENHHGSLSYPTKATSTPRMKVYHDGSEEVSIVDGDHADRVHMDGRMEGLVAPPWREQGKIILNNILLVNMSEKERLDKAVLWRGGRTKLRATE